MVHARFSLYNRRLIHEPSETNAALCAELETSAKCEKRRKEKNKAPVTGLLFWLFRLPTATNIDRLRWCQKDQTKHTLGARDFSSTVSRFRQVFIVTRGLGLRPKMCGPLANTKKFPPQARKTSGTQVNQNTIHFSKIVLLSGYQKQ